jgi:hypothetical protein
MVTPETSVSPLPPPLQQTDGNNEMLDGTTRIPAALLLCNANECQNTVDEANTDDEMGVPEELSSYRNGASVVLDEQVVEEGDLQQEALEQMEDINIDATLLIVNMSWNEEENSNARADLLSSYRNVASTAAVFDAEVIEERDLQQEVQERMENMTIDAMLVVNMSTNEEDSNKARADSSRRNSAAILRITAAALIILVTVSGTVLGTRNLRPKPPSTMVTAASPSTSISVVWEFARNVLTPLSGEDALMDESSPQYKALWWMVHEDPANMMMTMMVGNETQSSSRSMWMMIMERYTMALLCFSTNGPNWVVPYDFFSIQSICDWGEPIHCNEEGAVVQIRMGECVLK